MQFAENCHRMAENNHNWGGIEKELIFDQKIYGDEKRKEKERLKLIQELEDKRKENARLKKLLQKSHLRFDEEYNKLKAEVIELREKNRINHAQDCSCSCSGQNKLPPKKVATKETKFCPHCKKKFIQPFTAKAFRNHKYHCKKQKHCISQV